MERKLDLSRLTDEEAKHVWEVIQRDFNLRKKEEERLGKLKDSIDKEDNKRELLGSQNNLADSLCIRCLQPFKFLVNSKRRCLDCRLFTCKSCSRYNKKEHGWVCDNCRMTRVLKIGTLGWYHDNVRNRFKRFGSAKVMRSLYKRLNGEGGRDDDTQSMPDVRSYGYNGAEEEQGDVEAQRYKSMRKKKRLLSVHPFDFESEEYFPYSRRASMQHIQDAEYDFNIQRMHRRRSLDRYAPRNDDYGDSRAVRTRSLTKMGSAARQQYMDTSDEEECARLPTLYPPPPYRRRNSRASSQENLGFTPPINQLSKRMSAIENLLSRLEEKMTPDKASAPSGNEEENLRKKLSELAGHLSGKRLSSDDETDKKKSLGRGASMKDLSSSSEDLPSQAQKRSTASALCELTTEALRSMNATEKAMVDFGLSEAAHSSLMFSPADAKPAHEAFRELEENVYVAAGQSYGLESKLRRLEQSARNRFGGATDSELSELEDVVALTAARVQGAESEVSDIESKIAALSAVGSKKKMSSSQRKASMHEHAASKNRFLQNVTLSTQTRSSLLRSCQWSCLEVQHLLRLRPFTQIRMLCRLTRTTIKYLSTIVELKYCSIPNTVPFFLKYISHKFQSSYIIFTRFDVFLP
uniref:melanophilin a isoform X2 n=1 Tax=Doryrhamphus excisus TaxID=161450 RepID=UPI0025ADA062|nr:melanophilin a isoform X2 [Doryrhamphus excisus]